jgi:hypothetical protein
MMKRQFKGTAGKGAKKSKFRLFFLNLGRLVVDATKLSFGSLVLGTIIKGDISQSTLLVAGIIASGIGTIVGVLIITICEEK